MRVSILTEHDRTFSFELVAETTQEAAWITRFRLNIKREFPFISTTVSKNGEFRQYMSFSRKVETQSSIRPTK